MADLASLNLRPEHFRKEDASAVTMIYASGFFGYIAITSDEQKKNNPFVRFHFKQAIGFHIICAILDFVTCGLFGIVHFILALMYGLKARRGEVFEIPIVTNMLMNRGSFDEVKQLTAGGG